jgi:predicted acetyltransferase
MTWEVRTCASLDEQRSALGAIWHYFGRTAPSDEQFDRLARVLPADRVHGAWDGDRVVGGASAFPFELTVPGARILAAGVSTVGVLPTHRRRGILSAIMRAQLDACRARGETVAYLWASEDTIYNRFGYGIASLAAEIDIPRERTAYHAATAPSGNVRLVPPSDAEALVAPVYDKVAADTPGMFARTPAWWKSRALADPDWRRQGRGEMQCVVLEQVGHPAAYALYRLTPSWDRGVQTGTIGVIEAMGVSPEATRAIWRYLFDIDWMARVQAGLLPVDHPLLLLLAEPRRLRLGLRDGVWVRLVDVGAALTARTYAPGDSVVVEIGDTFCPWNAGRWRIGARGAARVTEEPELRCDVSALGSVYLGGFTWTQLAQSLRVDELRPGAIARAHALFATRRAPWCVEIF